MSLIAVVEADIGNRLPVRRNYGRAVRTLARSQRFELPIGQRQLINLRIQRIVLVVLVQVSRKDQILSVRAPASAPGASWTFSACVWQVAAGQLPRRSACRCDHEALSESRL